MAMGKIIALFLVISGLGTTANALDFKSKTRAGDGTFDETITGEGDFFKGSHEKRTPTFSWSVEAEFSESSSTNNTGDPIVDHSYCLVPGLSYENEIGLGMEGNLSLCSTPEEKLRNYGPEIDGTYFFDIGEKRGSGDDEFTPTMKLKTGVRSQEYVLGSAAITSRRTGITRSVANNAIKQSALLAGVTVSPWDFMTADATFTHYFYDRDVARFLTFLDSPAGIRIGAGGLANSISSFALSTLDFDFTFYPADEWSIELDAIYSIQAVDLSEAWSYEAVVSRDIGDWKLGIGAQREVSNSFGGITTYLVQIAYYL